MRQPVRDVRTTIEELRGIHEKLRDAIAEARRDATAGGGIGEFERETTKKLSGTLQREFEIEKRAMARLTGNDRVQVERMVDLLSRCDAIEKQLYEFDKRVDTQVASRLELVNRYLAAGKEELTRASEKLGGIWRRRRAWAAASPRRCSPRSPTSFTTWWCAQTSASSTSPGASRRRRPGGHPADEPEEPRVEGAGRGLPQGAEEDK